MWNKQEIEPNDRLKDYYRVISDGMNPPSELVNRVKGGKTVKLLAKSVHVKRFARAAACYVIGIGLFLGAIALISGLWEREEPVVIQPSGSVEITDASKKEIAFSSLYEREKVTEIRLKNYHYDYCEYSVTDPELISMLLDEIDVTDATDSSHYWLNIIGFALELVFEDGTSGSFSFLKDSNAVNYSVNDSGRVLICNTLQISAEDRDRLELLVYTQIRAMVLAQGVPAPEEYLGGEVTLGGLWHWENDKRWRRDLRPDEVEEISAKMQMLLTGLTLADHPLLIGDYKTNYMYQLHYADESVVSIILYPESGLIIVTMAKSIEEATDRIYVYSVPAETTQEYCEWLSQFHF